MTAVHHREGDVETVWFVDPIPAHLPVNIVITTFGFDIRGGDRTCEVVVRGFVPKWWSILRKEELAQTYANIVELKAQGVPK